MKIAKKESKTIGAWTITLLYDEEGNVVAAELSSTRLARPIVIAKREKVHVKLPQQVKRFLKKHGFEIE
ncbi:hypothetical protein Pyrfu_1880 [Pyrolobus fumarii 1A]|uniref:Uncharacterized protein n=1 Tax=Pyrolobus fumarii (strain DSM 11204 / 1A) TaxID=694429 RepID=G0ED55_PYRF1|nr:hypothetical protein [Pyrolobus fumarii]AEM39733.1 hypothetical protein Pyrfu_1880 [Pyrolobus fumarii 1A]